MNKTGFVAPTEYSPEEVAAMEKKAAADQAKYLEEMEMRKVHESIRKGDLASAAKSRQPIEGPKLDLETWKKQYPQYLKDTAENMAERTVSREEAINLGKKAAKIGKLKSLAEGIAWALALDPSEIAPSELPYNQEDMDSLESEMRMKNAPYNYPTKFESLRKRLGR